jgi:hypothetical protein
MCGGDILALVDFETILARIRLGHRALVAALVVLLCVLILVPRPRCVLYLLCPCRRMLFKIVPFNALASHPIFANGTMLPERFVDHWYVSRPPLSVMCGAW